MDPLAASDKVQMRHRGPQTDIRLPTSLLWICVFGGIAMLTWNVSLLRDQLEDLERQVKIQDASLAHVIEQLDARTNQAFQNSRLILMLDKRISELEAESETKNANDPLSGQPTVRQHQ